jgi:hypothetical protein
MVATPEAPQPPKLLEQVVARLRVKHYSLRTEQIYVDWIKRFVWFHGKRFYNPSQLINLENCKKKDRSSIPFFILQKTPDCYTAKRLVV